MKINQSNYSVSGYQNITGVVPGVKGQRSFPTNVLRDANPFVLLDHIGPEKLPSDFYVDGAMHPHRGFETITFMFEGTMEHMDNLGGRENLTTGGVQRMNAGKGISHGGNMYADVNSQTFHEVQLWVNAPAIQKMSVPTIHNVEANEIPELNSDGLVYRVIAGKPNIGESKLQGPIQTFANIQAVHIKGNSNSSSLISIPGTHKTLLVYALKGSAKIEDIQIDEFHTLHSSDNHTASIQLNNVDGEFLILSGEPVAEPIVMGGPFVMNTAEEIHQAKVDYANGYFN